MSAQNEDFLFAQEAQNLGYVTEAQVEEGFLLQKRMAEDLQIDERLAVILVKRGWLADEQARRVYGIIEPEGARSQIEGYRLIQKVGRGAMGTVYKALHKGLNRVVAIKILRRDLAADKTQIERLKREAKLLADLEHPNVVRAFDAGESNGFPYLVMEYVEGDTLRDRISREGPLSEEEALRITRALADALEKARRMGVVHRDVKPGNILLSKKDGAPKLMDLGLAKGPIDAGLTQHGATVGTPQFMSPEQAESPDKADTRSDIYSLGATLYAMVTGRPPFEGTTLAEIITKVMSQQPVPPGMANRNVSPEVSHLIERMMLKDASLRYATPALVIQDIDRIRGGQSIIPGGFQGNWEAYLLRKRFLAWRKRLAAGFAAVAVLVVGVLMWTSHLRKQAARERITSQSALLLEIDGVRPDDDQQSLDVRIQRLATGYEELKQLSDEEDAPFHEGPRIEGLRKRLEQARGLLAAARRLDRSLDRYRQAGNWKAALKEANDRTSEMRKSAPSQTAWQRIVDGLKKDSALALRREVDRVEAMPMATLEGFVDKHLSRMTIYEHPWIVPDGAAGDQHDRRKQAARLAYKKAKGITERVQTFASRFVGPEIASQVEDLAFYTLRREYARAAEVLRAFVDAEIDAWPALPSGDRARVRERLLGEDGLVRGAIEQADAAIDAAVLAYWNGLRQRVDTMDPREALESLDRFANEAERGNYYGEYATQSRDLEQGVREAVTARKERERKAFEVLRRRILRDLREGRPEGIRRSVADALSGDELTEARREDVRALEVAAEALEQLQVGALRGLASRLAATSGSLVLQDVPYRQADGQPTTARQWVLLGIDAETGELRVRRPRGDKRGETTFRIGQVAVERLRAWMAWGSARLSPLHDAILVVATLDEARDEPGRDLRPLLLALRTLQDRFGAAAPGPQWRRLIGELVLRLDLAQQGREDQAQRLVQRVRNLEDKWKSIVAYVDDLTDAAGRLRYTGAAEAARADMEKQRRRAKEALAKDELRRMFAGDVRPTQRADGSHELLFDLDDVKQLENFTHGFGQWEPAPVVTTGERGKSGGRLHLLPGVRGFLRDRPLVMPSPFDPARFFSIQFRARIGRGSAMLALDLDGVQIAICSFDPSFWKRRFRDGTPTLDDEESLPAFDFYGMGRGVAFHTGQHFGHAFPYGNWDWAVAGQGRNFARLQERGYVERAGGRLFAFEPGQPSVLVRVERDRGTMRLFVDDKLVIERENSRWASVGARSEFDRKVRNGSGLLQILTWTPMVIDDIVLRGTIRESWKTARRKAMAAAASKQGAADGEDESR